MLNRTVQKGGPPLQRWGTRPARRFASPTAEAMGHPTRAYLKNVMRWHMLKRTVSNERTGPRRRLPPEVLTDAEVCVLMGACGRYAATGLRNRALIALLYRAGLRINEALSLYPKDLELADGSVRVLNGKGGRSRTIGLDPGAAAIIEAWLDARSRINLDPTGRCPVSPGGRHPVFCTLRGHPMAAAYVRVMLKRLAVRAGIEKRVHAHGFRHTHAAQLRAEGVDIAVISRQLGHSSITTTARYLALQRHIFC